MIILRQYQNVAACFLGKFRGQYKEVAPNCIQSRVQQCRGKAQAFEPVHDIECKQQQLKEGYIRDPVLGWDLSQCVIGQQFADVLFDHGSFGVEAPNSPRMCFHVGHDHMIGIAFVLEEGQLLRFDGIGWNRAARHDESMRRFPFQRLVSELAAFPSISELSEPAFARPCLDEPIFSGDNGIAAANRIEEFDGPLAEESRIPSNADSRAADMLGRFGQAKFEKRNDTSAGGSIAGAKRAVPEFLMMRFEA